MLERFREEYRSVSNYWDPSEVVSRVLVEETSFIRLGLNVVQERDASDTTLATNWWNPKNPGGVGGLLLRQQGEKDYYFSYDQAGNILQVTGSNGELEADLHYTPYGKLVSGGNPQPYGFSTKRGGFASGLIDYGRRFYLPHLGSWLTRDPAGIGGGYNLYGFVRANPVNLIDPNGEYPYEEIQETLSEIIPKLAGFDFR